ncbi:ABC-type sugar transport system substrate-binding protein [Kitasatospora sp. MAP12-15]|uniref:sugar ABC transporter substrate-binding protein n=1 Tax=unclassified Kitasatospora TaxID=2633591 RepID=UPI00247626AC|nr:substrate-binding domain-containing protein [Kitasatospora sp. MAP12-44]MDH6115466.1 ABC-type sugar transport system substrate-binding protein [Kitasatospora sp. MAP12-44]
MRVLYVSPMEYGANAAVDAVGQGLQCRLAESGIELRVICADFRDKDWPDTADAAMLAGVKAGVDAIVVWVVTPDSAAVGAAAAMRQGIPVITLERPHYPVSASIVYPNFNHGVYMAEHLAALLPTGADVAVIGGPGSVDDDELVMGLQRGLRLMGLHLVNDPEDPRYKNVSDVAEGGRQKALNILADFPRLDGLIPYNDETMLGAVEALRETGRLGEVAMVSRNGTPAAVQAVRGGLSAGTWDVDVTGNGQQLADLVIRAAVRQEVLDGLCIAGPIGHMITPERTAHWEPWERRIPYHAFRLGLEQ